MPCYQSSSRAHLHQTQLAVLFRERQARRLICDDRRVVAPCGDVRRCCGTGCSCGCTTLRRRRLLTRLPRARPRAGRFATPLTEDEGIWRLEQQPREVRKRRALRLLRADGVAGHSQSRASPRRQGQAPSRAVDKHALAVWLSERESPAGSREGMEHFCSQIIHRRFRYLRSMPDVLRAVER